MIIEHLYVWHGKVALNSPLLLGKTVSVPLPDIHLKDIGKKEKGASPVEVASQLTDKITGSVAGAGKAGVASAVKMGKDAMDGPGRCWKGPAAAPVAPWTVRQKPSRDCLASS
jgi:hypothetical protein